MMGTGLPLLVGYLLVMTPGIETVWEFLMSGVGLALWLAIVYTVYRLAKWGYRSFTRKQAEKA